MELLSLHRYQLYWEMTLRVPVKNTRSWIEYGGEVHFLRRRDGGHQQCQCDERFTDFEKSQFTEKRWDWGKNLRALVMCECMYSAENVVPDMEITFQCLCMEEQIYQNSSSEMSYSLSTLNCAVFIAGRWLIRKLTRSTQIATQKYAKWNMSQKLQSKLDVFNQLCNFLDDNDGCQYLLSDLMEMLLKLGTESDKLYSEKRLRELLSASYGNTGNGFVQFVFDNADHNIRTVDGHGTFHVMGGGGGRGYAVCDTIFICSDEFSCSTTEDSTNGKYCWKVWLHPNRHLRPVQESWIESPGNGRRPLREIAPDGCPNRNHIQLNLDGWLIPRKRSYEKSAVIPCPSSILQNSNPTSVNTCLRFAAEECRKRQQRCIVMFDKPLFIKAMDIVFWADETDELSKMIVRLGGFHLLMSYMGAVRKKKNAVVHMAKGYSYTRALRAHSPSQMTAITHLILECCDEEGFLISSDVQTLRGFHEVLYTITTLEERSRTCILWPQYFKEVSIMHDFVRAERTGDWNLHLFSIQHMLAHLHAAGHIHYANSAHLYLQNMSKQKTTLSDQEFEHFCRSTLDLHHAGKSPCDGSSGSFAGVTSESSNQHISLSRLWQTRDISDLKKFVVWLNQHSPFNKSEELFSLSSGIIANDRVSCDSAEEIGENYVRGIVGICFANVTLKRKTQVFTLAAMGITSDKDPVIINPNQLFHRIVCVVRSADDLEDYLQYELAPYPQSVRRCWSSHGNEIEDYSTTYGEVCNAYFDYMNRNHGRNVIVVFDGYEPSTKDAVHMRRAVGHTAAKVDVTSSNAVTIAQEQFLSNIKAKFPVSQAPSDVDVLVFETAKTEVESGRSAVEVGADSDLLDCVAAAGEQFIVHLYGGKRSEGLDKTRYKKYVHTVCKRPPNYVMDLASLTPTSMQVKRVDIHHYVRDCAGESYFNRNIPDSEDEDIEDDFDIEDHVEAKRTSASTREDYIGMELRVQGQEARERYRRHFQVQGVQCFRRDAVVCKSNV
ncbi:hypothetical protein PR048_002983 [Dryococelus australis]|uniref:Uncharacterized protein n=1 Tax=Dryococelus australis TaxID=614101 RepID=A0ABQ9ILT5_9NEOP|nr:hypothetical protein PR048_002983 [Dryococelus australis]